MRITDWKIECRNLGILLLTVGLIAWPLGVLFPAWFLAALAYIGWTMFQLNRIQFWLEQGDNQAPPESAGLWGDVLDRIYRLQIAGQSERQRLRDEIAYLKDSLTSLADGAVMVDTDDNIEWCNRAAAKLLGLRYPEDRNQHLQNLIRTPEFVRYYEQEDYDKPLQMVSPYNNNYELQISVSYFGQGSRLLFARDITETNRLQRMRKDFVANVSHELRTPLTVISGYLQTLADSGSHILKDELRWRRALEQMLSQANRMENLVKDLIALSRLESVPETIDKTQVAVRALLESIAEEVRAATNGNRNITVECDDRWQLIGSADKLHSAFANLVMNAAKYSDDGGTIVIRWYRRKESLVLEVEDDGEGIEERHLPRLTERFYRVDNSRSIETGGTGLGLAIVKHILLRHQAELKIESSLGEGSTFSCIFPLSRAVACSDTA